MRILITGGCGFVGSSLAISFMEHHEDYEIVCLDNLKRRGSELNISRLRDYGIEFLHGDIRDREDLEPIGKIDLILECSAEPSVLAGFDSSPEYVINTNFGGTINCLELARKTNAPFVFFSTSRVYPYKSINSLDYIETETRYKLVETQKVRGASSEGFSEEFSLEGPRSLYGTTKLASELIIQEYVDMYDVQAVINRCGVLAGSWQFGKIDQGFVVLWAGHHFWKQELSYIGFGGEGKQVRDILHVNDLFRLVDAQVHDIEKHNGQVYNVGGGREISVSLKELTALCEEFSGNSIKIGREMENRPGDIRIYLSDTGKVRDATGWKPRIQVREIVSEIFDWIERNETGLKGVLY